MVISSDFRMGEHRDDDHEEDAPYFSWINSLSQNQGTESAEGTEIQCLGTKIQCLSASVPCTEKKALALSRFFEGTEN